MTPPTARTLFPILVGETIAATGPLVVPSYSSKALARISVLKTLDNTADYIAGPVLVSAYDIRHHDVDLHRFETQLIIVDSGGYETLVDDEGRRRGGNADHASFPWSPEIHAETLATIDVSCPVIAVSYDRTELAVEDQIHAALAAKSTNLGSSFLLKPKDGEKLTIESIANHAALLKGFDIIGLTEKEAGSSFLERLIFIGRLRALLDSNDIDKPIHVFGGLDPFMTPLYFLAGADIVDGLSWLRMALTETGAHYLPAHAAMIAPGVASDEIEWQIRRSNFLHLTDMQTAMRRFLRNKDYSFFSDRREISNKIEEIHMELLSALSK